ncbi:molecular chaperone GrpE [Dokdonia sp. Hel_I_63]|jgi:molecular chaperone GrpE|uniref:nucleotide exchange factor GrpE n=1 Tax=unclassified Dokdonia TaxID=2615033 RepID=UPI00020A62CE|nr:MULTISPECIES: nucleotide exchange factor GrpE [unclassified Dokdonia]AEE19999.1 GrpE protein [Dokdonia sp. 4H-3-7-5]TVZ23747.1 molecular chaperone GrpE [Dokdonia sp. Hel_I_63]
MATEDKTPDNTVDEAAQEQFVHEAEDATVEPAEEVKDERSELEIVQDQLAEEKDKFLRLFAEFENYKRRTTKERIELYKTAGQEVIQAMLPVADDFDRALNEFKGDKDDVHVKGMTLISNKFKETLKSKGLEEMSVRAGDDFNADQHEAITQIPAPNKKLKGKIVDVIEKGYKLGDKIIRFPKVVTGQ